MSSYQVTAVCVTHKIDKRLYRALLSVGQQSESLRLLLIFDGIAPNMELTNWLNKLFPNESFEFHSRESMGLTKQLNWAVKQLKTDWFARIDSDDVWCKDKVRIQLNVIDKLDSKLTVIGTTRSSEFPCLPQPKTYRYSLIHISPLLKGNPLIHSSVLINTKNFLKAGQYNCSYKYTQDYEAWLRVLKCNFSIVIIDADLTYVDQSYKDRISIAKSREQSWYELKAFCVHYPYQKLYKPIFYTRILRLFIRILLGRRL